MKLASTKKIFFASYLLGLLVPSLSIFYLSLFACNGSNVDVFKCYNLHYKGKLKNLSI